VQRKVRQFLSRGYTQAGLAVPGEIGRPLSGPAHNCDDSTAGLLDVEVGDLT